MTDAPPTLPPAGWFADPQNQHQQRWWTGQAWSEHIQPVPVLASPPPVVPAQPTYESNLAYASLSDNAWQSTEPNSKKVKRGFLDSPFERSGARKNIPGSLSLSFAIISFVTGWSPRGPFVLLSIAAGLAAIVLAIVGLVRASRNRSGKGASIAGLVIGILTSVILIGGAIATENASQFTFDVPALEADIAAGILDQSDVTMTVGCPGNPPADQGATFTCVARDHDGVNWMIDVTVQDDQGYYVWKISG